MRTTACFLLILLVSIAGCEKNESDIYRHSEGYINSINLITEKDTLVHGESTTISALVDGDCVSFSWEATQGDILGYGSKVIYVALLCNCGKSVINCQAKAGSNAISKSIIIYIVDE